MEVITTTRGTKMEVLASQTPGDYRADGKPHLANMLDDFGVIRDLICKRPNGQRHSLVRQDKSGYHVICSVYGVVNFRELANTQPL